MKGTKAAVLAIAATALAGCVSAPDNAPAWFAERDRAEDGTYPNFRDVPRGSIANTDTRYWRAVGAQVVAAGEAMRANPRAQPAPADQDPAAFVADARRELDAARDAHPQ